MIKNVSVTKTNTTVEWYLDDDGGLELTMLNITWGKDGTVFKSMSKLFIFSGIFQIK